ncbi:hypothetical protein JCM14076_08090 [Methylosoma difficile]
MKKILLSLLLASSMGAVSTVSFAETDPGRIVYAPAQAIDMVAGKVQVAIDALTHGSDAEEVSKLVKDALDASKEINANDKVDMARSRANNKLKSARNHLKDSATQEAEQELRNAQKAFLDLKAML